MKTLFISLRMLVLLSLFTGLVYPALVWAVGHSLFQTQAEGSLLYADGHLVGSVLLAQKTEDPRYFWPRPSAGDYATVASGASNFSWTSAKLVERIKAAGDEPADRVTTSGSGLDPHLSPGTVLAQFARVARVRRWSTQQRAQITDWIATHTEGGKTGPAYVNVLHLNLASDQVESRP